MDGTGNARVSGWLPQPSEFAACCRGLTAQPHLPAPDHPKTPASSPQVLGKVPCPVCQPCRQPCFMFISGDSRASSRDQRQDRALCCTRRTGTGAATLHSNPDIKSLISEAGKGSFIPSRLKRQMGTCSSDLNWADWEVQLLPSAH